jgi:hypothetical protein
MPSSKYALQVLCPLCGAPRGRKCYFNQGLPRAEPHMERLNIAKKFEEGIQQMAARQNTQIGAARHDTEISRHALFLPLD